MLKTNRIVSVVVIALFAFAGLLSACGGTDAAGDEMDGEMDMEDMDHDEHDHEVSTERIPNDGAVIRIVSPDSGATLSGGEVEVVIETEGASLGETHHWHVYIDDASWGMVMGADTSMVLRGVDPGEHMLSVYLSNEAHEELEDGDMVMITVEE